MALVLAYSVWHFIHTGILEAWDVRGGDVLSVFPGPLIPDRGRFDQTAAVLFPWAEAWNYGPVGHFLTYPLGFLPDVLSATRVLLVVDYGLVAVSFLAWVRVFGSMHWRNVLMLLCLWLNYFPLLMGVVGREVEILELALLSVAFWALVRKRQVLAGTCLGVAVMVKFLPAIFLPYLLLKRQWRALAAAGVVIAAILGVTHYTLDLRKSVTWQLAQSWTRGEIPTIHADNQALVNLVERTSHAPAPLTADRLVLTHATATRRIGTGLQWALLLLTFGVLWQRRHRSIHAWEWAGLLIVMITVPLWNNLYYLLFLVVPFSYAVADRWGQSWALLSTLGVAYLASGYVVPLSAIAWALEVTPIEARNLLGHLALPGLGTLLLLACWWSLRPLDIKTCGASC